jgi:hypothetical protein
MLRLMRKWLAGFSTLFVFTSIVAACNPGTSSAPNDGGTNPGALDCKAVLDCAASCGADADGGCTQACIDRANPTARGQLVALTQCDQTNGCNSDATCLQASCAAELNACVTVTTPTDGGVGPDDFPKKFTGKLRDQSNLAGEILDSTGDAVFVRDDQADPRGQSGQFAFYKLESVTYVATASGGTGPCTVSAKQTVSFTSPPPFENLVSIKKQQVGGKWEYDVSTSLTKPFPNALVTTCVPQGGGTSQFNAELNVAAGVPAPTTTDVKHLKATVNEGSRIWSWDLVGSN